MEAESISLVALPGEMVIDRYGALTAMKLGFVEES